MDNSRLEISVRKEALLKWIKTFDPSVILDSLQDLIKNPFLVAILTQIDADFKSIDPQNLTLLETCIQLSRFMAKKLGFRGIVTSHCDSVDLMISQMLYVCVHCAKKQEFISNILKLESQTQTVLMKIISQTTSNFQKFKQLKQVLQKVQELECQNEQLRKLLVQNQSQFDKYENKLNELKKQIKVVLDENLNFRKQKSDVLKELNITEFDDYMELYRRKDSEYQDLDINFKKLNQMFEKQKIENQDYKKKIIEDNQFIYFLSNESDEARSKWLTLKSIYANKPPEQIYIFDTNTSSPLKVKSLNVQSVSNEQNISPKKQSKVDRSQQFIQSIAQAKTQNLRLIEQSRNLEQKCQKYRIIIKNLHHKNNKLGYDNQFLVQKMNDLESVYKTIRTKYPA